MATTPRYRYRRRAAEMLVAGLLFAVARPEVRAQTVPAGWIIYPTPKENSLAIRCASSSVRPQRVSMSDVALVRIDSLPASFERDEYLKLELPQGVKQQKGMAGRQSSLRISGGRWLLGFDNGEWGGGLWLTGPDGSAQELYRGNVRGLAQTPQGVLVFAGLAHLTLDSGKVLIVSDTVKSQADLKALATLDGAPQALAPPLGDSVLVATRRSVSEISSSGTMRTLLHRDDLGLLYPNSIVSAPDGTIYIGMRLFVLRLVPQAGEYREEWLLPRSCEHFENSGCVCAQQ